MFRNLGALMPSIAGNWKWSSLKWKGLRSGGTAVRILLGWLEMSSHYQMLCLRSICLPPPPLSANQKKSVVQGLIVNAILHLYFRCSADK